MKLQLFQYKLMDCLLLFIQHNIQFLKFKTLLVILGLPSCCVTKDVRK